MYRKVVSVFVESTNRASEREARCENKRPDLALSLDATLRETRVILFFSFSQLRGPRGSIGYRCEMKHMRHAIGN